MSFTQEEAREALDLADAAEQRSHELRGYQSASPHLLLWGGIYALGYGLSYVRPDLANAAWVVLGTAGGVASWRIGQADHASTPDAGRAALVLMATFLIFIVASLAVLAPHQPGQAAAAFIPLVVAAAYVVLGLAVGQRLIWTGVGLGALTLLGFFAFPGIFLLWMAVVGGGGLALGGLWLRRV